jgi:WD40 repeat protein
MVSVDYPYRVGGSLAHNHPTYVGRSADRNLLNALLEGKFCYVFNCRQMGKSSLRVWVTHTLQEKGMTCASVDITSIGSADNVSKWYNGIITQLFLSFALTGKVNLKTWLREREELPPVQRLGQFIEEVLTVHRANARVFIFIDEIDRVLSLPFSIDDFFALIRYCYNQRSENPQYERLTFALFGVATPSDLIREKTQTPFNIGEAIELTGFTVEEATPLEIGLGEKIENPRSMMAEILDWTGGQPFLTQKVCQLLVKEASSDLDVASVIRENILHHWESKDEPVHFKTIAERLLRDERKAGRLLGLYQTILENGFIEYDNSPEQGELRLSGLVVKQNNRLSIYNRIYREIFNEKWLKKEFDKLRPYSEAIEAWQASNYMDNSTLLRGKTLQNALDWSQDKSLSDLDYRFLNASRDRETAAEREVNRTLKDANQTLQIARKKAIRLIQFGSIILASSILGSFLLFLKTNEVRNGIKLQGNGYSAIQQFSSEQLESLLAALKAGTELEKIVRDGRSFSEYPATSPILALQTILDNIEEKNRLIVNRQRTTIYSVSVSPDSQKIAIASGDGSVSLWEETEKKLTSLQGHSQAVYSIAFSPDGQRIATASADKTVRIQDLHGRIMATLEGHRGSVYSVNFSPDGQAIVTGSRDGTAKIWNLEGKVLQTLRGHSESVNDASFSPDGEEVATASRDGTIKVWKVRTGKEILSLGGKAIGAFYSVSFHASGTQIAGGTGNQGNNTVKIWERNGRLLTTLVGHQDTVNSVSFSAREPSIITASSDGTVKIWHGEGKEITTLSGHQESVFDAVVSPDEKWLVTGSSDGTARVWDLQALARHKSELAENSSVHSSVAIDATGATIAIARKGGEIELFDRQGKTLARISTNIFSILGLAFSPDGEKIVGVGNKGEIQVWNRSGKSIAKGKNHAGALSSVAFGADGREIFTGSRDGRIDRLDGQKNPPQSIASFSSDAQTIYGIAVSPDGEKIATTSREVVKIRNQSGKIVREIVGDSFPVYGLAFSPDSQQIATISRDGTARRWDMRGNLLAEFKVTGDSVYAIAFRNDGKNISIVSRSGQVTDWPVETPSVYLEKLLDRGCDWLEDYLATRPEERAKLPHCAD